ncbi:hypothetical protein [Streptomyces sp. NPDC054975]
MGEFLNAAVGFPTMLYTAALIVVAGFWLLVLCRAADREGFDSDVDTTALRLDGVPVSVAATLSVVVSWLLSMGGSVLLGRAALPGSLSHVLSTALLLVAPIVSWRATRRLVPTLAKLFPDEPGPSQQDLAGLPSAPERHRSAAPGHHRTVVPVRRRR